MSDDIKKYQSILLKEYDYEAKLSPYTLEAITSLVARAKADWKQPGNDPELSNAVIEFLATHGQEVLKSLSR